MFCQIKTKKKFLYRTLCTSFVLGLHVLTCTLWVEDLKISSNQKQELKIMAIAYEDLVLTVSRRNEDCL